MKNLIVTCNRGNIWTNGSVVTTNGRRKLRRGEVLKGNFKNVLQVLDKRALDVEVLWFYIVLIQ